MAVQKAGLYPRIFKRIEGAAVHIGVIQSSQHNDGGGGIKLVGQRKQQGHTGQTSDTGHCPHHKAQNRSQKGGSHIAEGEQRGEAMH